MPSMQDGQLGIGNNSMALLLILEGSYGVPWRFSFSCNYGIPTRTKNKMDLETRNAILAM